MSINFGNVGDIIAVGKLAWGLAKALIGRRSPKEYQGLMKELQAFDNALLQVAALWQNSESCPELEVLGVTTRDLVKDLRDILLAFRLKVDKKYGTSMRAGGSGRWLKDASKKMLWLKEKEDILELRRKLHLASDTLTVLILAANGKSNRLASSAQAERVERLHESWQESTKQVADQMAQLRLMDEKLDSQAATSNMILSTVKRGVNHIAEVHSIVVDVKSMMTLLHNNILPIHAIPRSLGTQWQQEPVTLEDALGNRIPLPLELVNSWDMLDMILSKRFEKHPGHNKIQRREYVIEEASTGRALSRTTDLRMCLGPGQKIDMSVVFPDGAGDSNYCPRCRTKSATSSEIRTQCTSCNMWFQRVTEVDEAKDDISESSVVEGTSVELEPPRQLHPKFTGPVLGPADFQRVRMLRKTTAVPLSTSDRSESPQAVSLEEVDTASLISMPSKDAQKFDNKQGSTTRDIDGLSISSPDDDSDNISPEPGCLKHDRPQKIPAEEVNIVSSTSISSEDKLDNGQESMIQDFARLVTAGFKENLHDYNIAPEFGYTKQDHGKSRLGHRHHGGQGHGSTSHRTRAPEYHWEWFWACCYCAKHAAMSTSINVACPGCQHIRCDYCPVESVKIRAPEFNNFQTNSHRAIF